MARVAILVRVRPVHQHQVDVVDTQSLQARLVRLTNPIDAVPAPVELGSQKDLGAVYARVADGPSNRILVAIVLCGIDQPVASLQCRPNLALGFVADQRRRTESEDWNLGTIAKWKGRSQRGHKNSCLSVEFGGI